MPPLKQTIDRPTDRHECRQALAYPEVHARKCLVKNVLKEEDLRPAPSLLSSLSLQQQRQQQHAGE